MLPSGLLFMLWHIDRTHEKRDLVCANGEYEGSIQNEVDDLLRRFSCASAKIQFNIAGGGHTLFVDSYPGVLVDAVQIYRDLTVNGGRKVVATGLKIFVKPIFSRPCFRSVLADTSNLGTERFTFIHLWFSWGNSPFWVIMSM